MIFLPVMLVSGLFPGHCAPFQSSGDCPRNALEPSVGLGSVAGTDPFPLSLLFVYELHVVHSVCAHYLLLQGSCGIKKPKASFKKEKGI